MATPTNRRSKSTGTTKKSAATPKKRARPRVKAEAVSGRDPVKKGPERFDASSLMAAQRAFLEAAWAMNPMAFMMRQQAAALANLTAGHRNASLSRRTKRK